MPGNTIAADTNNNKNTSPSTKTNTNTTQKTTFGQWLTKDDKWIPLKISWLCKLPLTSSLHNPDTMMSEEDETSQDAHPCISKIALFIAEAKNAIHIRGCVIGASRWCLVVNFFVFVGISSVGRIVLLLLLMVVIWSMSVKT
mmetsp:Transcript_110877/g.226902  ORF Transcript_110877/g.226902 Transcript_110877/m.226902 type:complete len:142 (-) Transcript_110877:168-593(-)